MLGGTRSRILSPFLIMCLINSYDFHIKTMFGSYFPPAAVCRGGMLYLRYLCLLSYSGVLHVVTVWVAWLCLVEWGNSFPFASDRVLLQCLQGFVLVNFLVFCVLCFWFVCLRPVSFVPNVANFSGFSVIDYHFGFLYCLFQQWALTVELLTARNICAVQFDTYVLCLSLDR